jgi:hypothetical protein
MPLPSPRLAGDNKESEKEFVSRCAGSEIMNKDYPDNKQRVAVCYSLYRQAVKKKRAKGSAEEPTWAESEAEIEDTGIVETESSMNVVSIAVDKKPYGDIKYADPGYQEDKVKRYPLDNEEHIRSAWNYIHQERNAEKYTKDQLEKIKARIVSSWKKSIDPKGPPTAE